MFLINLKQKNKRQQKLALALLKLDTKKNPVFETKKFFFFNSLFENWV